ncbi:GNAT family N-acetyltransferase [Gracilimonas sp. BCB1]|uniref:GNAT family N-acetyltransferase n=1 Tax=Gracilimonas sp. BCB1 TaxID=3152362 RepID=UPI0032D94B4D
MESNGNKARDVSLRKFCPQDLKTLLYIFRLNVPEYFEAGEETDFRNYLQLNSDTYYTILSNGLIAGGAGYRINKEEETGSITWIFLHPDYTGEGIGKYSAKFLLGILQNHENVKFLRADTSQHGYKFFGSLGFSMVKKKKDFWGRGLDLYRMEMMNTEPNK